MRQVGADELSASGPGSADLSKSTANSNSKKLSNAERLAQGEALVKESLYFEIAGSNDERNRLLSVAQTTAPNYPPAMWHSGHVAFNNQWMKLEDVPEAAKKNTDLGAYEKQRDKAPDTFEGHLNLARWCAKRGLQDQARAHYNQVLQFDPDNAEAPAQLGFKRVGNSWVAKPELDEMVSEAQRLAKALTKWLPRITAIRKGLVEGPGPAYEMAKKQLEEIKDPEALPALEYLLSAVNEECAKLLVEKLASWSELPATHAIVRQAIYSPWDSIRQLAATKLEGRPREDFVPKLLAAMHTPLTVQTVIVSEGGRLVTREVFARESRDAWEVVMIDTAYVRDARPWGSSAQATSDAMLKIRENTAVRLLIASMQSANTDELNRRVMTALSIATHITTNVRPEDWWTWWDNQNETSYSKPKPTDTDYKQKYVTLQDKPTGPIVSAPPSPPPPRPAPSPPPPRSPRPTHASCFVAGTPVWTVRGQLPIERIRIGDLVASQDPESGEVAFKPVMQTTVRQNAEVVSVDLNGSTLKPTGGHLFWVAGEGWTKARNLKSGQTLHCASGTVQVSLVSEEPQPEQTYNLVVADFNTYFVGPEKILSHDVTEKKPTHSIVPGLAKE